MRAIFRMAMRPPWFGIHSDPWYSARPRAGSPSCGATVRASIGEGHQLEEEKAAKCKYSCVTTTSIRR
jgi:hypothetical protein